MLLFCLSVLFKRELCEHRMGDGCSTISSPVMAVIESNRRVKRVRRQGASHLWIVEHQRDVCTHKQAFLQVTNISPGSFFVNNDH